MCVLLTPGDQQVADTEHITDSNGAKDFIVDGRSYVARPAFRQEVNFISLVTLSVDWFLFVEQNWAYS